MSHQPPLPPSSSEPFNDGDSLFSCLISDIKSYSGKDPLLPWLRGIRKMKDCLPPVTLKEKLPRFLQKCAHTFDSDRRYRNDLRYLRVWLQLMDYVDEPLTLLKTMESNLIGTKHSVFYQAYALYYEKTKKFDDAETMYHLGVKNLAEPLDELQKSYEQFIDRMEKRKNKKIQQPEARTSRRPHSGITTSRTGHKTEETKDNACSVEYNTTQGMDSCSVKQSSPTSSAGNMSNIDEDLRGKNGMASIAKEQRIVERESGKSNMIHGDDTVVVKFVDTAIVGKSEAEDACHHGLVDPTVNLKEAMNAINNMFREPIDVPIVKKPNRNRLKEDDSKNEGLQVFIDEGSDHGIESSSQVKVNNCSSIEKCRTENIQYVHEPFQIYIDDEGSSEVIHPSNRKNNGQIEVQILVEDSPSTTSNLNGFVFPCPKDNPSEVAGSSLQPKAREDTVIFRFVGSTISDEPKAENVCHHGLVDPTINLKEAMDDINNMFGQPIDFVRSRKSRKQEKARESESIAPVGGFSILADEDLDNQNPLPPPKLAMKSKESDLFEKTMVTKEAMDDINKMFSMPLEF